ncbi:hypothetical protein ACROYT_G037296 [Oculina patagonica]
MTGKIKEEVYGAYRGPTADAKSDDDEDVDDDDNNDNDDNDDKYQSVLMFVLANTEKLYSRVISNTRIHLKVRIGVAERNTFTAGVLAQ